MTILCGLCWNIDSRKIIWHPRAHFGSENESLKGLMFSRLNIHFILYLDRLTGTRNVISDEQRALSNVTSRHNVIYILIDKAYN